MKTILFCILLIPIGILAQTNVPTSAPGSNYRGFDMQLNVGYDIPKFTSAYTYYHLKGGPKFGAAFDYTFNSGIGLGLDYDFIWNNASTPLSDLLYLDSNLVSSVPLTHIKQKLTRHFIGIGPHYVIRLANQSLNFKIYSRVGIGLLKGGELVSYSSPSSTVKDYRVLFSGFDSKEISFKVGLQANFKIANSVSLALGVYHMRYKSVTPDAFFDTENIGNMGLVYGESDIRSNGQDYYLGGSNARTVEEAGCSSCSSTGVQLGLVFRFAGKKKENCITCGCPDDTHKVVVTVEDGPSGKVIPGADVAIKDMSGNIVATGTTNSFGAVDFGEIPHNNYYVTGSVYGVETTTDNILDEEFTPNAVIQKKIYYEDLRFILKGKTINKQSRDAEPNVVVNLTKDQSGDVQQDNSGGRGEFAFHLDKHSSYELVGIKDNRLSDIERSSTVGLTRSTTLFVSLELGMDNFDCGKGTILDIKYEFDKFSLTTPSKFELDRLVRYMNDHATSRVELSSHTDSRGSNEYNWTLSDNRARSAVNYIESRGISMSRIVAKGYGETKLVNNCADGVECSEEKHQINRRTEAALICK